MPLPLVYYKQNMPAMMQTKRYTKAASFGFVVSLVHILWQMFQEKKGP